MLLNILCRYLILKQIKIYIFMVGLDRLVYTNSYLFTAKIDHNRIIKSVYLRITGKNIQ